MVKLTATIVKTFKTTTSLTDVNLADVKAAKFEEIHNSYVKSSRKRSRKPRSEESKRKVSEAMKGNKNAAGKRSYSASAAMKLADRGSKVGHGNKGRVRSEETKARMAEAARRRWAKAKLNAEESV